MKRIITVCVMALMACGTALADRFVTMATAKHLTITTTDGTTYYYIVGNQLPATILMKDGQLCLDHDTFAPSDVKSLRVKDIEQFILDEDSTTFDINYTVDHGMLVLRRTMPVGQWSSLVLPVSLTVAQVRDAFGYEARVATVRGLRQADYAAIDIETETPGADDEVLIEANKHYLLMPSREPDLAAGRRGAGLANRPYGPLYLVPNVTQATRKRQPDAVSIHNDEVSLMLRGTYVTRDGSGLQTRRLFGGVNPVYLLNDEGAFGQYTDSVATKAFTSWFSDVSQTPKPLQFYIDGVTANATQIAQIPVGAATTDDETVFDMQGRPVGRMGHTAGLRPGIYVKGGRKFIVK